MAVKPFSEKIQSKTDESDQILPHRRFLTAKLPF
jgi:hypothetical protein